MISTIKSIIRPNIIALSFWISMFLMMLYHIFKYIDPKLIFVIYFVSSYGMKYYYSKNMGIISSFIPDRSTIISWGMKYMFAPKPNSNPNSKNK